MYMKLIQELSRLILLGIYTIFVIGIAFQVKAQDKLLYKHKIQTNFSLLNTSHYVKPALLTTFDEPFVIERQTSRISKNLELSYYRAINISNELKFSIGFTQYRFSESGLASTGGATFSPYEYIVELEYFNMALGHRYFILQRKINPYIENSIFLEHYRHHRNTLNKKSIAAMFKGGILIRLTEKADLDFHCLFKSAITRYNRHSSDTGYFPFGFGCGSGLSFKF
jgi:hypothetical protein